MTSMLGQATLSTYAPGRQNLSDALRKKSSLGSPLAYKDAQFGGMDPITGTVVVAGAPDFPVHRFIVLMDERTKKIIRSGWSDPETGAYSFTNLVAGPWTLISWDHTGIYNAVIVANVFLPLNQASLVLRFNDTTSALSYWNGSAWVSGRLKRWDGSDWVLV